MKRSRRVLLLSLAACVVIAIALVLLVPRTARYKAWRFGRFQERVVAQTPNAPGLGKSQDWRAGMSRLLATITPEQARAGAYPRKIPFDQLTPEQQALARQALPATLPGWGVPASECEVTAVSIYEGGIVLTVAHGDKQQTLGFGQRPK